MLEICRPTADFMDIKRTNEWVLQSAGTQRHLLKSVKKMKITYFGHMMRKKDKKITYFGHMMRKKDKCLEKEII